MSEFKDYIIACTPACDLTQEILDQNNVISINYKYVKDGEEYEDDYYKSITPEEFYGYIKDGGTIKTSQMGYGRYLEFFEKFLKEGKDVMLVALSSGITGDTSTAMSVAKELNEKYENNKVYILDSTCASSGYGMLLLKAVENRNNKMSIQDNYDFLEEYKRTIHHWFISTDLSTYVKGGRISGVEGFFGAMLKICPILYVDYEGRLIPFEKIRTKARAMDAQLEKMHEYCKDGDDYSGPVFICHSVCYDDAKELADMIQEEFKNVKEVKIFNIGSSIGAHTGPYTISLFFEGKNRKEIVKED